MRSIVFDTGPVISLTTNNLLWILEELRSSFEGEFLITDCVVEELVARPLRTKKFKFEALQVKQVVAKGVLQTFKHPDLHELADSIFKLANKIYSIHGKPFRIVEYAEMEVLAAALLNNAAAIVIDERTTRKLIEDPRSLELLFKRKFHVNVKVNMDNLRRFQGFVKGMKILRSVELVTIAFERGLLDKYLPDGQDSRRTLLESVLWGVKLHGCSVSHIEIDKIVKLETRT